MCSLLDVSGVVAAGGDRRGREPGGGGGPPPRPRQRRPAQVREEEDQSRDRGAAGEANNLEDNFNFKGTLLLPSLTFHNLQHHNFGNVRLFILKLSISTNFHFPFS